jgi:hypothetical protein
MIFNFIIHSMLLMVQSIFSILPTIPATPTAITSGAGWVTDQIVSIISILRMVYGSALLSAIVVILIAILNFEWIYHTSMWIIRKIPVLNIK